FVANVCLHVFPTRRSSDLGTTSRYAPPVVTISTLPVASWSVRSWIVLGAASVISPCVSWAARRQSLSPPPIEIEERMSMTLRPALLLLVASLLGGCVTTGDVDPMRTSKGRDEARDAYVQLGIAYIQQGDTQRAKVPLKNALELDPSNADAHAAL